MKIAEELGKALVQLIVIGMVGGAVAWFYARLQRDRELVLSLLRDFANLHGRFMALRFRVNSFYVDRGGARNPENHPLPKDQFELERWRNFEDACNLVGEMHGIRPLLVARFPETEADIDFLFSKYQDWRRYTHADRPIYQTPDGHNEIPMDHVRDRYSRVIKAMRADVSAGLTIKRDSRRVKKHRNAPIPLVRMYLRLRKGRPLKQRSKRK